ncbi:MAG: hypothetical protein WEA82_00715 [Idiomarina sp.]
MFSRIKQAQQRAARAGRRLLLWFMAAAITLVVLFIGVVVYQLTTYQPDPPPLANCAAEQLVTLDSNSAEVRLYQCERGNPTSWQGYELWLHEPASGDWQRMLTAPAEACLQLQANNATKVTLFHQGTRGALNLAEPVFIYENATGVSATLVVDIAALETSGDCASSETDRLPNRADQ